MNYQPSRSVFTVAAGRLLVPVRSAVYWSAGRLLVPVRSAVYWSRGLDASPVYSTKVRVRFGLCVRWSNPSSEKSTKCLRGKNHKFVKL